MGHTTIEWTSYRKPDGSIVPGYTFNPVIGCQKKSPGCKFCYAEHDTPARVARGQGAELWGPDGQRKVPGETYWRQPKAWNLAAASNGEVRFVFCASQSDWLEDRPEWTEPRARLLKTILETPNLTWLLLSKEPWNFDLLVEDAAEALFDSGDLNAYDSLSYWLWRETTIPNVRLGVSVENQEWADKRREAFRLLPGQKFVSYEPALGPVDWTGWEFVSQIISGGESGSHQDVRPSHPDWHRAARDWCIQENKAFFFKQWGKYEAVTPLYAGRDDAAENGRGDLVAVSSDGYVYDEQDGQPTDPRTWLMERATGRKAGGRLLDGQEWSQIPGVNF